jgi:hypothetical protein
LLAGGRKPGADLRRLPLEHLHRARVLTRHDGRYAALEDAGFLPGDFLDGHP